MKNKRKICAALMLISFMSHCAIVKGANDEIITGTCDGGYTTPVCVWSLNKISGTITLSSSEKNKPLGLTVVQTNATLSSTV